MSTTAAVGHTWGIPGPAFLGLYLAAIGVTVAVAVAWRWRVTRSTGPTVRSVDELDDYALAVLAWGPEAAALTALHELWRHGAVAPRNEAVEALARDADGLLKAASRRNLTSSTALYLGPGAPSWNAPLIEHTVLAAVAKRPGCSPAEVIGDREVRSATDDVTARLEERGLLRTPAVRRAVRRPVLAFLPVLALGGARLVAGTANQRPVLWLSLLVGLTVVAASVFLFVARRPAAVTRLVEAGRRSAWLPRSESPAAARDGVDRRLLALHGASMMAPAAMLLLVPPMVSSQFGLPTAAGAGTSRFLGSGSDGGSSCGGSDGGGSSCGGGGGCGGGGCGG